MKKLIFGLMFLFICSNVFAADHWVYVAVKDKSGVTADDDKGLAKKGDVVAALPVNDQNKPTKTEEDNYLIFMADLTDAEVEEMTLPYLEGEGNSETKAYRKNTLDLATLGKDTKGKMFFKINKSKIKLKEKTSEDFARYEVKRKFYAYVQRPAIRLANIITRKAFAETITTCNHSGEDYNTVSLWEAAVDGDLVTSTTQPTLHVYDDDGTLTDNIEIDGSTTDSSYYMKVSSPSDERHDGTEGTGAHIHSTDTYRGNFYIRDEYTVIEWLELTRTKTSPGSTQAYAGIYIDAGGANATIQYNLIYDMISSASYMRGIRTSDNWANSTTLNVFNNILYNVNNDCMYIGQYNTVTNNIYNNTMYNCGSDGIDIAGGDNDAVHNAVNNIAMESTNNDYNTGSNSFDTDTNNLDSLDTVTFESTSAGSEDFHLTSGATDAIDAGSDLSGTFTDDIDGDIRSGWSIGADEYVSASTRNRLIIIQ